MNYPKKSLIVFLSVTLTTGFWAGYLIMDYVSFYDTLNKPFLAPPKWIFPVAWSVLYIMMAVSANMVYRNGDCILRRNTVILYGIQLILNFLWPIIFFRSGNVRMALYDIIALWLVLLIIVIIFSDENKTASVLFTPYLLWVSFAVYLNFAIYLLN